MNDQHNDISAFAHVSPNAIIGKGNIIKPGVIIYDNVIIGDNNYIGEYTTIGTPGEFRDPPDKQPGAATLIGDRNVIREYVSIQAPVLTKGTSIGNDNFIMNKTHIAHDCWIGDHCTIAPFACLGGSVKLNDRVNMGIAAVIHPRLIIEEGAMIGMNATITRNVKEWRVMIGVNKMKGWNTRGMAKAKLTEEQVTQIMKRCVV